MAAARSPTTPTITFEEPNLVRVATNSSDLGSIDEDDKEHAQDWSVTTDAKDSWANRERRRSSVWSKVDDVDVTANKPKGYTATGNPRRGSILSVWSSGKDKKGRSILAHDDSDGEGDSNEEAVEPDLMSDDGKTASENGDPRLLDALGRKDRAGSNAGSDRRGSILSLWSQGKDANGRSVMLHDDEEWKD